MQNTSDLFTPSSARPWDGGWHQSFREPMWIYISIIVAVVVLLLNLKSLPLVYHLRILNGFSYVLRSQHRKQQNSPRDIFLPLVTESHSPMIEIDFNFHKSNSTYLSDHDVARCHLMCTLFSEGITRARFADSNELIGGGNAQLLAVVAGTSCNFKREIAPYVPYEMWSRVLTWDRKWIWGVTHFVEKKPRKEGRAGARKVYAIAVSKMVFKKSRLTVEPEAMLKLSGLLPKEAEIEKDTFSAVQDVERERQRGRDLLENPEGLDDLLNDFNGNTPLLARRGGMDFSFLVIPKLAYLFFEWLSEHLMIPCYSLHSQLWKSKIGKAT